MNISQAIWQLGCIQFSNWWSSKNAKQGTKKGKNLLKIALKKQKLAQLWKIITHGTCAAFTFFFYLWPSLVSFRKNRLYFNREVSKLNCSTRKTATIWAAFLKKSLAGICSGAKTFLERNKIVCFLWKKF